MVSCARRVLATAVLAAVATLSFGAAGAERQIVGYLEEVRVFPGDIPFKAKVDTGARTSSIDVRKPVVFKRDGQKWVRFGVRNKQGETVSVERPVVRESKVRRAGTETESRYVVRLGICLGDYFKIAEVNLNDRTGMNYNLLIGRLFLGNRFLVDASRKYLTKPDCPERPEN